MQITDTKPNLKKRLFWDYDYEHIDWQNKAAGIVERVIERGTRDEWDELVSYYSKATVLDILKNHIRFLPDEIISDACDYFKLKPDDLLCYTRKQSRKAHWI